jgi:hypothetical protein
MSYFPSISQNVTVDTANSSTANINAGATWNSAGTGTSTLGVNSIQVAVAASQNLEIYVDQGRTDSSFQITDTYYYYPSIGNFGITVQAVSAFVRVRAKNTSGATATGVLIDTVLCPIADPMPRSLDRYGNEKVALQSINDLYGFEVENTPTGEMRATAPTRLVGAQFEGTTVDPNFWTVTNTAGGTSTQANAQLTLATNTTANGATSVFSVRRARYVSASANCYRSVVQLGDTGTANNTRRWGVAWGATMPTITDGAYYQISGTTFSIVTLKGGTPTAVDSGSFNGILGTTYTPTTNVATYEIYWTNSKVYFSVGGILLHTVSATTTTWANTVNHHVFMDNVNSAGSTSAVTMSCRVASIRRLGPLLTQPNSRFQSGTVAALVCKYGPGNLHSLVLSSVTSGSVVTLWDNTAASGTTLWSGTITIPAQGVNAPVALDMKGMPFFTGLTLTIATQNSNALVIYE